MQRFDSDEAVNGKLVARPGARKLIRGKFYQIVVHMPPAVLARLTRYQLAEYGGRMNVRTAIVLEAIEEFLTQEGY